MINLYFGKAGSGKTTLLAKTAIENVKRIDSYKKTIEYLDSKISNKKLFNIIKMFVIKPRYDYVVSNVRIKGCVYSDFLDIGIYEYNRCLMLFDEITLDADSRDFKKFHVGLKEAIVMHRHYHNDIYVYTQMYDRMDKTIRDNVNNAYYISKFFGVFTKIVLIPNGIIIPEETGEIVQGYRKPIFIEKIINTRFILRPLYYRYFDSYYIREKRIEYPYEEKLVEV